MTNKQIHSIATRFLTYVEKDSASDCLLFVGAKRRGYGAFRFKGKIMAAHRVSYLLFVGQIPDEMLLRHTCTDKRCVNLAHLELATHTQVIRQAHIDGRFKSSTIPDRTKHLKLTWALADKIREDQRNNCTAIAKDYGLSRSTVSDIRRGKTWNREKRKVKINA